MSDRDCTEDDFLKDVATHAMTVIRDDGLHRHLSFRRPGTYCMGFDIVTWPGYLAYTGDMGCYVFTRLADMFEFFRTDRQERKEGRKLYINRSYWAEKIVAGDRSGRGDGIKEYSPVKFRQIVTDRLTQAEAPLDVIRAAARDVLAYADDGEHGAMQSAIDFDCNGRRWLQDFWEADCRVYTYRFEWCCYALAWSIEQYDNAKVTA